MGRGVGIIRHEIDGFQLREADLRRSRDGKWVSRGSMWGAPGHLLAPGSTEDTAASAGHGLSAIGVEVVVLVVSQSDRKDV